MIETLLRVKWWDWSLEEINENADVLISPELFMKKYGSL
jgi:aminocyclitol acetyltransferase